MLRFWNSLSRGRCTAMQNPNTTQLLGAASTLSTRQTCLIHSTTATHVESTQNTTTATTPLAPASSTTLSTTTKDLVNRLRDQLRYYAVVEIMGRPLLVTARDQVVVNRLRDVQVGDVLKLNRVRELGSRDFTIRGSPYVSEEYYNAKATVIEHTKGPMLEIIKRKRRKNYRRRITHKQTYTVLRISELEVNKLE
ncbi:mitochondrial 54S ribosomal protein bL21m [Calcarisporiella thermophila]|uniref:mitochondrial 54S ribosomal protein bL21m n=1 Tax=Calcarisporiella thermophila TaxID=911321 RepID=UPI003742E21C